MLGDLAAPDAGCCGRVIQTLLRLQVQEEGMEILLFVFCNGNKSVGMMMFDQSRIVGLRKGP